MSPRLIIYLDYLLKNSSIPRMMTIDWAKCSEEERQEVFAAAGRGELIKGEHRGQYYISSKKVYDDWQKILWNYYVDFADGKRGATK